MRYGQGMADTQYGNWWDRQQQVQGNKFSRLAGIAGLGADANDRRNQLRAGYAGGIADTKMDIGNARAGGIIQRGNITANQWQTAGNAAGKIADTVTSFF